MSISIGNPPGMGQKFSDDIDGFGLFVGHREMLFNETREHAFASGDEFLQLTAAVLQHLHRSRLT